MKFNWGMGIAIFYTTFVVALVYQVVKSTQYDHSLVAEEYYAKDLAYQQHYDKLVNSNNLQQDLQITKVRNQSEVSLQFPKDLGALSGEIHFFCPSASTQDFRVDIDPDEAGRQTVSVEGLKPGLWKVKVDWKAESGKAYFKEESVVL